MHTTLHDFICLVEVRFRSMLPILFVLLHWYPEGTRRNYNVFITSKRRRRRRLDVMKTLLLRHVSVGYWHRNGKVEATALVVIADVKVYIQRLLWRPGQSSWQPFRFHVGEIVRCTTYNKTVCILHGIYIKTLAGDYHGVLWKLSILMIKKNITRWRVCLYSECFNRQ